MKQKQSFPKRTKIINELIEKRGYQSYLEIGVRDSRTNFDRINGKTLAKKIGVDPAPIHVSPSEKGKILKITSDEFFELDHSNNSFDLIFIDGLHTEEQVTKDIYNSMIRLNENGMILIHDCSPPTEWHQRSFEEFQKTGGQWNGTVWKAFVAFRKATSRKRLIVTLTIDEDWGIGVIWKKKNTTPITTTIPYDLSWKDLENNRNSLLGLMDQESAFKILCP